MHTHARVPIQATRACDAPSHRLPPTWLLLRRRLLLRTAFLDDMPSSRNASSRKKQYAHSKKANAIRPPIPRDTIAAVGRARTEHTRVHARARERRATADSHAAQPEGLLLPTERRAAVGLWRGGLPYGCRRAAVCRSALQGACRGGAGAQSSSFATSFSIGAGGGEASTCRKEIIGGTGGGGTRNQILRSAWERRACGGTPHAIGSE
eukprot:426886-Prymnesium_polylepis.1